MGILSRSWAITTLTFSVIGKDKEMILFPLLGTIASALYIIAVLVPSGILQVLGGDGMVEQGIGILQYTILFLIYLGLAFIATFCNLCVVYTTKIRFEGGDATFAESFRFGLSKLGLIFQWSVISATVGVFLAMLENIAQRFGFVGQIVLKVVRSLLGMVWSILTLFVVPVLVYENISPVDAIQRSSQIFKKTWGENIARSLGLGLMNFLAILVTIGATAALVIALPVSSLTPIIIGLGIVGVIAIILIFNVANTVFNTALYVYASTGQEPEMFAAGTLANTFTRKS